MKPFPLSVLLTAVSLGACRATPPAERDRPEPSQVQRFRLRRCSPDDARQVFVALLGLPHPLRTFPTPPPPPPAGAAGVAGPAPPPPPPPGVAGPGWGGPGPGMPFRVEATATTFAGDVGRSSLRAFLDLRTQSLVARGTAAELRLVADLVAALDAPPDKPPPAAKGLRAFRARHLDAEEMLEQLRELRADGSCRTVALPGRKLLLAVGPEDALKHLEAVARELDVPADEPQKSPGK
jgi:hypothetical protein